jgi:flagellar protein FliO/FliZ
MGWDVGLRAILSLALVFGLIFGAGFLAKRYGVHGGVIGRRPGKRRLAVIESLPLDNRRRLLLLRKDDREHLVIVGGASDVVLESGSSPKFSLTEPLGGDAA